MTVRVDAGSLSDALYSLNKVVTVTSNSPIYKCVLIKVKDGRMLLRGTDITVFVERQLEIENDKGDNGSYLIVFESLFHYAQESQGRLSLDFNKSDVRIKSKTDSASPKLRSAQDFMDWPRWDSLSEFECDGDALIAAISRANKFVSTALVSPVLYNVSVSSKKGRLVVKAADGYRYILLDIGKVNSEQDLNFLIPYNAASKCEGISGIKKLGIKDSMFGIKSDAGTFYFNLNSGNYPTLESQVPQKFSLVLEVEREKLLTVFSRAVGFSDVKYRKTSLVCDSKSIAVTAESDDRGKYAGKISVTSGKGKELAIMLDANHILDFVNLIDDNPLIHFTDSQGPTVLKSNKRKDITYVTFPLVSGPGVEDAEKGET